MTPQQLREVALKLQRYFAANSAERYAADLTLVERWLVLLEAPQLTDAEVAALLADLKNDRRDGGTASYELDVMVAIWVRQRHGAG